MQKIPECITVHLSIICIIKVMLCTNKNKSLYVQIDRAGRLVGPVNCQSWVCGSWIESRVCCKMGPSSNTHAGHNHSTSDLSKIKKLLVSKNVANVTDSSCVVIKLILYILVPIQNKTVIFIPLSKIKKSPHKFITRSEACPTWRLQTRSKTWAVLGCFMERVSQPSTLTLKPDLSMRVWFGCHHKWSCNKPNQQIPSATGSIVVRCQATIRFLWVLSVFNGKIGFTEWMLHELHWSKHWTSFCSSCLS